ncbi:zinc finger CCCH domain-containing protein 3 [Nematolebias whitei]|uniref:zinc finger CCCH domain-containing protein 3 n=1 Tax=Nematolebias whitei TaxID=451745 RepID=UPI0018988469|nr:zinc finger CCCH domain-containing protein 3 [Nematolebias whitei]
MEEREALKRQIELLQDLINKHKSVHGDAPFAGSEPRHPQVPTAARGGGFSTSVNYRHSSRGRPYAPQSRGSWRKTYSLRNTRPPSTVGHPSISASSSLHQSHPQVRTDNVSLPGHSRGNATDLTKTATLLSGSPSQQKGENSKARIKGAAANKLHTDAEKQVPASTSAHHKASQAQVFQQKFDNRFVLLSEKKTVGFCTDPSLVNINSSTSSQSRTEVQNKTCVNSKTSTDVKKTVTSTTPPLPPSGKSTPALTASSRVLKQPAQNVSSQSINTRVQASFVKKSKFTWVKSQTLEAEFRAVSSASSSVSRVLAASASKTGLSTDKPSTAALSKRTPPKKLARKLSPVAIAPKTSKYKWVSSSRLQARTPRKVSSPKASTPPQRILERGDTVKKAKAASAQSVKLKKGTAVSPGTSSSVNRYRWKPGGQSAAASGGAAVSHHTSAFHWTAEKNKGIKTGFVVSPSLTQRSPLLSSTPRGFKLRSRMKIIRKSASSGTGSEKGGNLPSVKFSPRTQLHAPIRSPVGVRRTPSRELVSFGRHKLRRLSPTSLKTNPASSFYRSPASQRVFRTRYKMVTRPSSGTLTYALPYHPTLSWRTKKIQSARSFLQNRLRSPHDRHPSFSQRWTGSGMCWIRGSLYRVSANKLSRTRTANMSINRTGKSSGPHVSPVLSRHASRAVQRSIAIIRHARQKKQQKQYCMYYNRFGKCNRGTSCPFIHDPDKVAVCTRFLRGTCKQADGACPFSHKIAKEKMPVCSYFLKGTCNNNDCPYSHVYVSRKAEVCEDFVKGYCPEGEKCKKKHTLVCPDFSKSGSCPRGSCCKLQHRQRVKRSPDGTASTPAKRPRTKEPVKRPHLFVHMPQNAQAAPGTPPAGPLALPSFISLSSSPEEAEAPNAHPANVAQVKEKKLQIKPRL